MKFWQKTKNKTWFRIHQFLVENIREWNDTINLATILRRYDLFPLMCVRSVWLKFAFDTHIYHGIFQLQSTTINLPSHFAYQFSGPCIRLNQKEHFFPIRPKSVWFVSIKEHCTLCPKRALNILCEWIYEKFVIIWKTTHCKSDTFSVINARWLNIGWLKKREKRNINKKTSKF